MNLLSGQTAPVFDLPTDGNKRLNLTDLRGQNVVLYFYPKDDTPGCTIEAKDFRDAEEAFKAANTVIVGVSKDSVSKHDKFKEKYCLPFALVSDEEGKMLESYGVWIEKSMYGKTYMGIERTTFLIDSKGVIQKIWKKVSVSGHAQEVLEHAEKLEK
jgi:peroxiredoxin Q/BCP